jgi:hypothetical protein
MKKGVFLGKAFCINLSIWVFRRKLHHHISGCSDDLPGQKNIPLGFLQTILGRKGRPE